MSDEALADDPEYWFLCDCLNKYDAGDRSIALYKDMRGVYAYAS